MRRFSTPVWVSCATYRVLHIPVGEAAALAARLLDLVDVLGLDELLELRGERVERRVDALTIVAHVEVRGRVLCGGVGAQRAHFRRRSMAHRFRYSQRRPRKKSARRGAAQRSQRSECHTTLHGASETDAGQLVSNSVAAPCLVHRCQRPAARTVVGE